MPPKTFRREGYPGLDDRVLGLINDIYAAAVDSALWPALLTKLADALHGTTTSLIFCNLDVMRGGTHAAVRCDPDALQSYAEHYINIDCFGLKRKDLFRSGQVLPGQMLCPDEEMIKTEYYNDFLRPIDLHHQCCAVIRAQGPSVSVLASMRPKRAGRFGDADLNLLRVLTPHFQRALRIHEKLAEVELKAIGCSCALDRFPIGVLLVGRDGKVLALNRSAERIVAQKDGLQIEKNSLRAARNFESASINAVIQRATQAPARLQVRSGGVSNVSRPSMRRPYQVLVFPISTPGFYWGLEPKNVAAAVFITDPEASTPSGPDILTTLFDLTPTEARLASLLMQGLSIGECQDRLRISANTIRTHLKHVFSKTSTRRQSELLRLLLSSPAALTPKDGNMQ